MRNANANTSRRKQRPGPRGDQGVVDPIFYPDRSASEVARFRREGKKFFETAVRKRAH
jgi:hypothetical protein